MVMFFAFFRSVACATSVSILAGHERVVFYSVDDAPSAQVVAARAGAVIELDGPIGIMNDQGMTSKEFRESLLHVEERGLRRVVLDLAVPAGRDDSIAGYLREIRSAQDSGVEVFAFVRAASADGWCIALSCDGWACTQAARTSLQKLMKSNSLPQRSGDSDPQGNKGMEGRRKPPANGGQMPGMGQGLGLSGADDGAGSGSNGDWSDGEEASSGDGKKLRWPAPSDSTWKLFVELTKSIKELDQKAVEDRLAALRAFEVDSKFVISDRFCATQRELRDLAGAMRKNEAELKKQSDTLKSVKQKDGPRAEGLQKLVSGIKSRMIELQLKMAALRNQP